MPPSTHPHAPAIDAHDAIPLANPDTRPEVTLGQAIDQLLTPPRVRWGKLLKKTALYVGTELVLNLAGLDTVANYSEFLANNPNAQQLSDAFMNWITLIS